MAEPLIVVALDAADTQLAEEFEGVDEWYVGERGDHLYPTCPGLARTGRPPRRGSGRLYPEAGDVCLTCLRWWRARKAKETGDHGQP
ncbi:hypothetical protein Q9G87_03610 [Nonomuraea sp. G32]|nr:hypothetical protein [Nonomuraea sp. G32]